MLNYQRVPQIFLGQNDSPYLNAENICFGLATFSLWGLQSSPGDGRGLQMAWSIAWWRCQGHMWFWCLMFGCPLIPRHDEGWIIGYTTGCLGRKWPVCFFPVLHECDYWGSIDEFLLCRIGWLDEFIFSFMSKNCWMIISGWLGPSWGPAKRLKSGDDFHVFGADPGVGCEVSWCGARTKRTERTKRVSHGQRLRVSWAK